MDIGSLPVTAFDAAFAIVVGEEGAPSADSNDPGDHAAGAVRQTVYGWAPAYWAANVAQMPPAVRAQMPQWPDGLTLDLARLAYRSLQWARIGGDEIPAPLALVAFDAAVNQGISRAAHWLQLAVGAAPDGIVGPGTIAAAQAADLLGAIADLGWERDCAYHAAPEWMIFGHGWIRRLTQIVALSTVYTDRSELCRYLPHPGKLAA